MNNFIKVSGRKYTLQFGKYPNGTIAMEAMDKNGEPFLTCTVNWEANFQGDNYAKRFQFPVVVIKNYSENEGMVKVLEDAGVITVGGAYMAGSGGTVEVHGLTEIWQCICNQQLAEQDVTNRDEEIMDRRILVDGDIETTIGSFIDENSLHTGECLLPDDELINIRSLRVGDSYEGGGGAAGTFTVKRLADQAPKVN